MALLRLRGISVRLSPSQYSSLLSQRHSLGQTASAKETVLRKIPNEHSINPGGFFSGHFKYSPIRRKSISINIQECQGENVHWTTLDIIFAPLRSFFSTYVIKLLSSFGLCILFAEMDIFILCSPTTGLLSKLWKIKSSSVLPMKDIRQWVESRGDEKWNCPFQSLLFKMILTHPYPKADNLHLASCFVPQH